MTPPALSRLEVRMTTARNSSPEAEFRRWIADGDYWRHGEKRTAIARGHGHDYEGAMHVVSRDGSAVASVALHPRFVEHMDADPWTERMERRWLVVDQALRRLHRPHDEQRRMELRAWRYFACPEHFRHQTTIAEAIEMEVDTTTLYRSRDRVTDWLWDWIAATGQAGHWA